MIPRFEPGNMTDSERVHVQTYVTSAQRERWREEATELNMSNAEYVRTMVQAGRRSFDLYTETGETDTAEEDRSSDATPGIDGVKSSVLDVLDEQEFADWDALLAGVTDDVETRLEDTLGKLQSSDRIRYSGRHSGYTVIDDER